MRLLRRLFLSTFLLSLTLLVGAQNQPWRLFKTADGLPSNRLSDVLIEGTNQSWIASDSGLIRYDGQSFFTYNSSNSTLPDNNIRELNMLNGLLCFVTDSGFSIFDGRSFTNYSAQNGLLSNNINGIAVDTNDVLWIASNAGVSRFDGSSFTHDSGKVAKAIAVDDSNRVYILKYTIVFNIPNSTLTVFEVFDGLNWSSPPMSLFTDYYRSQFYKTEDGKIYLLPSGGGKQFYAELRYPFQLIKKNIFTESPTPKTPRYINEFNSERWLCYWGVSSIYKGLSKDSNYLPLYLLPPAVRLEDMGINQQHTIIATDQGLLVGPPSYSNPSYDDYLDINEVKAEINIKGALFHNYENGRASFEYPIGSNSHMVYSATFQLGIKKDSTQSNFQIFPQEVNLQDFESGPYNTSNIVFGDEYKVKINKSAIDAHRLNYNQPAYQVPSEIANWPAVADSNLTQYPDLAPYIDINQNGCYDPMNGDYPLIKGDQAIYWINHPKDNALPFEYHWMVYGYNQPNDTFLNKSVFVQLRIINRDSTKYDYIKPAFRIDSDLGNPGDDFNGSDSLRDLIYFYNGDAFDETFRGITGYGGNPPALGVRTLSDPMTSATFFQTAISYPFSDAWNYLHGMNGDSTFFKNPFTNQNTRYQFTGNPNNNTGWTESNLSPNNSIGNAPGDRKGTSGIPAFSLAAGESHTMELVVGAASRTFRTGIAEYIPLLQRRMDQVKFFYDAQNPVAPYYSQNFSCGITVGVEDLEKDSNQNISIFPNPTNGLLNIKSSSSLQQFQLWQLDGKLVHQERINGQSKSIDLRSYPKNIYILKVQDVHNNWMIRKLVLN